MQAADPHRIRAGGEEAGGGAGGGAPRALGNAEIAAALRELGELYQLDGAAVYRVLAYRTAAKSIEEASVSVAKLAQEGRATQLPGVGETIQQKVLALVETGEIPAAAKLRQRHPEGLLSIMRLPGIGAKRARTLHDELGIDSVEALRQAAQTQRLRTVRGFGQGLERRVLSALKTGEPPRREQRVLLPRALEIAEEIVAGLREAGPGDAKIEVAGSIRRQAESVRDLDIVASTQAPEQLAQALARLPQIAGVQSAGTVGARALTHSGIRVDLRICPPSLHGSLLQHFTGSAAHNAALREMAARRGLHVSEHGIEDERAGVTHACETEQEVYRTLGLAWVPPELREDRGELQAADLTGGGGLPKLIVESDVAGDLHCHSTASDGVASIEEMAREAMAKGYSYLAITDHSASHGFGNDVSPDRLRRQIERIAQVDEGLREQAASEAGAFKLLAGSEVNILPDGSLDYEDDLLSQLDWVIASVHTSFSMSQEEMTKRMIAAIEHPLVDAIGHPTGRLIERRQPYALDMEAVIDAAARTRTALEINANPNRRDLSETHARAAAAAGCLLVIDSDAHSPRSLGDIRWGVASARRAWLRSEDVANTRGWQELRALRERS